MLYIKAAEYSYVLVGWLCGSGRFNHIAYSKQTVHTFIASTMIHVIK
jgi:hypothetical protein